MSEQDIASPTEQVLTQNVVEVNPLTPELRQQLNELTQLYQALSQVAEHLAIVDQDSSFLTIQRSLLDLGKAYLDYLNVPEHLHDMDSFLLQKIASMAKGCFMMNIKMYVDSVKLISEYVSNHPKLFNLNPPENPDSPWNGIKRALYYTPSNDIREQFREQMIAVTAVDPSKFGIKAGTFDHLERFLVDPQDRAPKDFIPEYLAQHANEISQWASLSYEDFQIFLVKMHDQQVPDVFQETLLRLDEELASISPEQFSATFPGKLLNDKQKKLRLIRDLRFGRTSVELLKAEWLAKKNEITSPENFPPLLKILGPKLQKQLSIVVDVLKRSVGQDPQTRISLVEQAMIQNPISDQTRQEVLSILREKLLNTID